MPDDRKSISDITDTNAKIRVVSNGFVAWLEDDAGNHFTPPRWLLRLVADAEKRGRNEVRQEMRQMMRRET